MRQNKFMEQTENKKKILVIDDDNDLNTVLVDKLNFSGFEAIGATDGVNGLDKALSLRPDAILLDLVMPKMGGLEMLQLLRKDEWGKQVKVIILTLLEKVDYVADAVEGNIYGYIVKTGHSLDEIVEKVEELVNK